MYLIRTKKAKERGRKINKRVKNKWDELESRLLAKESVVDYFNVPYQRYPRTTEENYETAIKDIRSGYVQMKARGHYNCAFCFVCKPFYGCIS